MARPGGGSHTYAANRRNLRAAYVAARTLLVSSEANQVSSSLPGLSLDGVTVEQLVAAQRVQGQHRPRRVGLSERVRARDAGKPVPSREEERETERRAGAHNPLLRVYDAVAVRRLSLKPRPARSRRARPCHARPRGAGPPGPRCTVRRGGDSGDSDSDSDGEPGPGAAGVGLVESLFERVSRYVENHPGCDADEVALAVPAIRGAVPAALQKLRRAGFVEERDGRYRSFKPYRVEMTA